MILSMPIYTPQPHLSTMTLPWSLSELFPECNEYIVRLGWMEDGEHIWVQLLNRPQKLLKVVVIALTSFTSDRDKAPLPYVLWEERTEVWINVSWRHCLEKIIILWEKTSARLASYICIII